MNQSPEIPVGFCQCGCGQRTAICKLTNRKRGNVKGLPVRFVSGHCRARRGSADYLLGPNPVTHRPDGVSEITLLYRGVSMVCLLDTIDYKKVESYRWTATRSRQDRTFYAVSNAGQVRMHRLLLPKVKYVDHRDRNGLNNRQENLRPATMSQNGANRRKKIGATSIYFGVCRSSGRWQAQLTFNRKSIKLGSFESEEAAARAYDAAALEYHGEFAHLNFPATTIVDSKPGPIVAPQIKTQEVA